MIVPATPTTVPAAKPVRASTVEAEDTNETVLVALAVTVYVPLSGAPVSARDATVIFVPTGKAAPAPVAVRVAVVEPAVRAAAVTEIAAFVAAVAVVMLAAS